jgi:hypothetical protein
MKFLSPYGVNGQLSYSNTSAVTSNNAFADLLLGQHQRIYPGRRSPQDARGIQHLRNLPVQDDWHATKRLTLNFGLRLSFFGTYREKNNSGVELSIRRFYVARREQRRSLDWIGDWQPLQRMGRLRCYAGRSLRLHEKSNGGIPRPASASRLIPRAMASGRFAAAMEFSSSTPTATNPIRSLWSTKARALRSPASRARSRCHVAAESTGYDCLNSSLLGVSGATTTPVAICIAAEQGDLALHAAMAS